MTDLVALGADVTWPDHLASDAVAATLAGGRGGYGRLDELAEWLAGVQGNDPPHDLARPRAVVFGTATPSPLLTATAELVGVGLQCVAIPDGAAADSLAAGAALADEQIDSGTDLVVVACPGTSSAAVVLVSVLTDTEPVKVLPRGAHVDPDAWMALAVEVRDARRRVFALRAYPLDLVEAIAGPDLIAAAGFVLRATARRTPVVLDGTGALAAAVVAYEAQPRAVRWWRAADRCPDPAHEIALTKLGLRPVLDLGARNGDGTAGLLAVALLRTAARVLEPSADV